MKKSARERNIALLWEYNVSLHWQKNLFEEPIALRYIARERIVHSLWRMESNLANVNFIPIGRIQMGEHYRQIQTERNKTATRSSDWFEQIEFQYANFPLGEYKAILARGRRDAIKIFNWALYYAIGADGIALGAAAHFSWGMATAAMATGPRLLWYWLYFASVCIKHMGNLMPSDQRTKDNGARRRFNELGPLKLLSNP